MSLDQRILLNITLLSDEELPAAQMADAMYWRINNSLNGNGQLPNVAIICEECNRVNARLSAFIRKRCLDIRKDSTSFDPNYDKVTSIPNVIEDTNRKRIRIMVYPGDRNDINSLNMNETTHNMIVQFNGEGERFCPTEPHDIFPSFFQVCDSEETAILHIEALLVDACFCHYMSVTDVANSHTEKQKISAEKVEFLRATLNNPRLIQGVSPAGKEVIKFVAEKLTTSTPYISFLSIFTVAVFDLFKMGKNTEFIYFNDYCILWSAFQKWYFEKHNRFFKKGENVENPRDVLFQNSLFWGQISPRALQEKLQKTIDRFKTKENIPPFGEELRHAVVVIEHIPANLSDQFDALFSGNAHPARWDIVSWSNLHRYYNIMDYLEIIPFMIE